MANDLSMAGAQARRPFVGRDRELEELGSGLADATAGRGSLFLLVGGAGIGKTRLADEAARAAEAQGCKALWGRCWETGGAPAYWPFIQVLREIVRGPAGARLCAELGAGAPLLAPLLPELVAAAPAGADADPVAARFRLFEAVVALLRAAAAEAPLFIVLDDLHAADPSSLALLHFLARNLRGLRALVVGTYRDEEARRAPEVGPVLTDVAREGAYLPLPPLATGEIAALVASAAPAGASSALVGRLERASEGNPLFLSELLRLLAARGELATDAAGAWPIPDTVREVIGRRLARLSTEARALLAEAAVIGRDFSAGLLAALSGLGSAELLRRLEEAQQAGITVASGPGGWRFSHVLVREGLYRALDPAARAAAHQRVAAALEASGRGDAVVAEVAHHRLAALPEGDPLAAASAARRAAERAMAMLAFEDAATLLGRAHAALLASAVSDPTLLCELQLSIAMAWIRAGDTTRGRAACLAAADEARRLGAGELFARAALTYGAELILAISDATLLALLEEALALLPPAPGALRAQVMARLAAARMPALDPTGPGDLARAAVAMARATGDGAALRAVLLSAGGALADYAPAAERAALSEELSGLARAAGDRFQLLRAESRLVFDCFELARFDRCQRAIETYEAVAREFNQPRHIWPGRLMRAMLASALGNAAEAAALHDEASALAQGDTDLTTPFVLAWALMGHALESESAARFARAQVDFEQMLAIPGLPIDPIILGHLFLAAGNARFGDPSLVRAHLAEFDFDHPLLALDGPANAAMAEALVLVGDRPRIALAYQRLRPFAGLLACHGRAGIVSSGPYDLWLGVLATEVAPDAAEAHFEAALAQATALSLRPYVAQGKYWYARFLAQRPGQAARARALATDAAAVAGALGLGRLGERIAALEAAPAPAPQPAAAPRFAFRREGEYWTVTSGTAVVRLKDGRGVQMLAELIANPGREYHVLALSGATGDEVDRGDAGETLDADAIADYRARLEELDEELREAEAWGDAARTSRARDEREAIAHELAQGVGLGGRARRTGGAAERARTNVQRRIRGAIRKISESQPALGAYLDRTVRTGSFCVYEPI